MNGYERFLYWEGFRHGREWANAVTFGKDVLEKAESQLMKRGVTPLTPANKDELVNAMKEAVR